MKNLDNIFFGVDYYPEHWKQDRWETDAKLMKEAGFDAIRLAEFSWAKMEPEINRFCFDWLDDVISLFAGYGIKAILGTPTAAPPAWLIEMDTDILPVNSSGVRLGFGGRHHVCHSNAKYREHASRIVTAMADHFRENNNVIGWQIDNELGNSHDNLCMCDRCQAAFQKWLERKFRTIENLNESYGTVFWSQNYSGFHQIPAPRITPNSHNPSLLLDWKRFCSDLIIDFQQQQIEIIRNKCSGQFITGNFMGFFDKIDYFQLAENLDFVSHDQYPLGYWVENSTGTPPAVLAASLDLMRGIKEKPFWLMEQQAGPTGWEILGSTPRPGQLRLWTAQSVAHGADAVIFFRWRTCLFGTEQYWHGVLPHNGIPGRRYNEIKETVSQLRPVMECIKNSNENSGQMQAEAAILFSYEQNWAFEVQPHHPDLDYIIQIQKYYRYFYSRNIPVDFISAASDFLKYKLIIAPLQFLIRPETIEKIRTFVSNGGKIIFTMRSGVKNENNVCFEDSVLPCGFAGMLGIEIHDYDCVRGEPVPVRGERITGNALKWCDIIELKNAKALAFYDGEYYKGTPAGTVNSYGSGEAFYIGFEGDNSLMDSLMDRITVECQVKPIASSPDNVEVVRRGGYIFVLNHSGERVNFMPKPEWKTVTGTAGEASRSADLLEPYGVAIYYKNNC